MTSHSTRESLTVSLETAKLKGVLRAIVLLVGLSLFPIGGLGYMATMATQWVYVVIFGLLLICAATAPLIFAPPSP